MKFLLLNFGPLFNANCNSNHMIYSPLIFWHEELPPINAHAQFSIWQRKTHRTVQLTIGEMDPTRPNTYQEGLDL